MPEINIESPIWNKLSIVLSSSTYSYHWVNFRVEIHALFVVKRNTKKILLHDPSLTWNILRYKSWHVDRWMIFLQEVVSFTRLWVLGSIAVVSKIPAFSYKSNLINKRESHIKDYNLPFPTLESYENKHNYIQFCDIWLEVWRQYEPLLLVSI